MSEFLVEYDLLAQYGRQLPSTRRTIIEAQHMSEALSLFIESVAPGMDCVRVQIMEATGDRITRETA